MSDGDHVSLSVFQHLFVVEFSGTVLRWFRGALHASTLSPHSSGTGPGT